MEHKANTAGRGSTGNKIKSFTPQWNNASSGEDENWYVVEMPVLFDKTPGFIIKNKSAQEKSKIGGQTALLVLKNKKSGQTRLALMYIVPDKETTDPGVTYFKRNKHFSGTIFYTDAGGEFINGWLYEKGKIVAKSSGVVSNRQSARAIQNECQTIGTDWYERTCYFYDDNSVECTECEYVGTVYQTYCSDEGGGGNGGGYEPPVPEIINNVQNPCIRDMVNAAISLNCKKK